MQPIGMAEPTGAFEVVTDWNTIRHNSEGEPGPSNNRNHICRLQVPEHPSYLVSSRKLLSIVNRKNNRVLLCRNIFVPVSGSSKIYFKNNFSTPGTFLKRIKRSSGLLCRNCILLGCRITLFRVRVLSNLLFAALEKTCRHEKQGEGKSCLRSSPQHAAFGVISSLYRPCRTLHHHDIRARHQETVRRRQFATRAETSPLGATTKNVEFIMDDSFSFDGVSQQHKDGGKRNRAESLGTQRCIGTRACRGSPAARLASGQHAGLVDHELAMCPEAQQHPLGSKARECSQAGSPSSNAEVIDEW